MNTLTVFYIVVLAVAGSFLAWTYTKPGKKWLANL